MRFAEVFLRLGCSLVGWMVLYAHTVWLAALHRIGCGPDGGEMHALLLGMAPLTVAMASMLRLTRPFVEIQSMLRWLAIPLALLLPFALYNIWSVGAGIHRTGLGICSDAAPAGWHYAWSPAQVLVVLICGLFVLTNWLNSKQDRHHLAAPRSD
ncbi:MAG: hypothetical protein OEW35_13625 [Gammaproteobacteria bacterium]|nr:hypothetical protein [Gammaproteobacteria bacterium]MDH4254584.1 hypothetical protein [Gammaproteobacteria bacterium]MDH5310457.1 hypothetical protein [Gammaproteobacteria bacterium]